MRLEGSTDPNHPSLTTGMQRMQMTQSGIIPLELRIEEKMREAQEKAWEALSGYKFWMFGYHASAWIRLNQLLPDHKPNPFKDAVDLARTKI